MEHRGNATDEDRLSHVSLLFFAFLCSFRRPAQNQRKLSRHQMRLMVSTHSGGASFFIIVSVPDEAAEIICCSIDLPIFADKVCHKPAVASGRDRGLEAENERYVSQTDKCREKTHFVHGSLLRCRGLLGCD